MVFFLHLTDFLCATELKRVDKRHEKQERILWPLGLLAFAYYLFLPSFAAQAAVFFVNSPSDVVDTSPGNGICETIPGIGFRTLRAAIMEANALAGADHIVLPSLPAPISYTLTIVDELTLSDSTRPS